MLITEIFVLFSAIMIFVVVLNLVRLRRLREEYSWLWLGAAVFYLIMALKPQLIGKLTSLLGITNSITAFTFFSLLFIVLILIHFSVQLSKLNTQMKDISQQVALIDSDQLSTSHHLSQIEGHRPDPVDTDTSEEGMVTHLHIEDQ
jgi:hypothetical protein